MSDYLPRYADGDRVPVLVGTGGITGGSPITVNGTVPVDADTTVAGVSGQDGVAGGTVTVWRSGLHIAVASGAIANGDPLCTATNSKVRKWVAGTDPVAAFIGRAWAAAANGASVTYALTGV